MRAAADERAESVRWAVEGAYKEAGSLLGAAKLLNQRGIRTAREGRWHAASVKTVLSRLGAL